MAFSSPFEHDGTHRLIPAKFAEPDRSVRETLRPSAEVISDLSELDAATNERKLAEQGENIAIGTGETAVWRTRGPHRQRCLLSPWSLRGRFNSSRRGAWYAGVELADLDGRGRLS